MSEATTKTPEKPVVNQKTADPEERHYLSLKEIFETDDIVLQDVYVEPWKGWVTIKVLSGEDMTEVSEMRKTGDFEKYGDLLLVAKSLVNKHTRRPLMSFDQLARLQEKSLPAFQVLQDAVMRLNNLGKYAKNF